MSANCPNFKGMAMHLNYFDALPAELKGRIVAIRRDLKIGQIIVASVLLLLTVTGVIFKYLKARGYG